MSKSKNIIAVLACVLIISLAVTAVTFVLDEGSSVKGNGTVTKISTPEQTKVLVPKWAEQPEIKIEDLGTNLAKGKAVTASGYQDVYEAVNATDGKVETYWEGKADSYPNLLTVDLEASMKVGNVRMRLNPDKIWGKRVQSFSILGSLDGKEFKEIIPSANYQYDPKIGNLVTVSIPSPVEVKYIRIEFTQNTGAVGGQVAELEIYAPK
jgi:hypothetical protein